ncbi:MAG: type I restriction-modification system endonuclease [Planctomycetes bacterium]|nr:type I restriction-modification system endonuclease [Planctomycetota bacterium]
MGAPASANFRFLAARHPLLDTLGAQAERFFAEAPVVALISLRAFGEHLAQAVAAHTGVPCEPGLDQRRLLDRLWDEGPLQGQDVHRVFHDLRRAGNRAAHEHQGDHAEALHQLRMCRKLAVWFHRDVAGHQGFKPGPFVPPPDPRAATAELRAALDAARAELARSQEAATEARRVAEEEARLRAEAEARARERGDDLEATLALAQEVEARLAELEAKEREAVTRVAAEVAERPRAEVEQVVRQAQAGGQDLELSEAETRRQIDHQLRDAGWEADSDALRWSKGARPVRGRNLAIAEWPTASGPADYVLFAGLTPLGVVEAKKRNLDVSAAIEQAKRYSRGYEVKTDEQLLAGPWGDHKVPFLFSTNGRAFLRQHLQGSGIWFLDARRPTNHPRALEGWHRPDELLATLQQDVDAALAALRAQPPDYLDVRDYQLEAIKAVEQAIADGRREVLLAMATGTGKTRTAVGLLYRLVKAKRFRRVLFLVDRTILGTQAANAFKGVRLENAQTFTDIYDVKEIGELVPEPTTRLHFATVQGMVQRLFESEGGAAPSVGQYDCIVIDEAHRGYNLDRDMTEAEQDWRSHEDYVSKYRRVLDHFDAVRIGLTATPAKHTVEIFGQPVFTYSYRRAVVEGHLVDHEPPIKITTKLARDGITWEAGSEVTVLDTQRQQLELFNTPDEVHVDVEAFNRKVVTRSFNEAVCRQIVKDVDPSLPGKTLVFCVDDAHADLVVDVLKAALDERYGEVDDDLVQKITGRADKPEEKVRRFQNEAHPKVAVTVDLLTTGVDVPEIVNLVFLRRIRSRILYDQMIGRATRRCREIHKERFRIFDAVDLYAALKDHTDMHPVVTNPNVSFGQLIGDVIATAGHAEARREFFEQLLAKLQRKGQRLRDDHGQDFETQFGAAFDSWLARLRQEGPDGAAAWFRDHPAAAEWLDRVTSGQRRKLISTHADEVVAVDQDFAGQRPDDYLESFHRYLDEHRDALPALIAVAQRPRDLTRQQLRELKLALDAEGYSEVNLQTAWRARTNAEIAASIVGFIRKELLDSPLLSFEERVDRAVRRLLSRQPWTQPQRRWLERIGKQVKQEVVVDREALDSGQFKADGGFRKIDKVFDGRLDELLADLHDTIWEDPAA